jgi:V-type H+-transporting ATPase proteolipid subunit
LIAHVRVVGLGAAYGTAQAGLGICRAGSKDPAVAIKGIIPVAMAGVRAIYGLVLSIIILSGIHAIEYSDYSGLRHLSAGICCGVAQFVSGVTVGVVGESSTQAISLRGSLFASSVLVLIFSEALALYGLICGMIMAQNG